LDFCECCREKQIFALLYIIYGVFSRTKEYIINKKTEQQYPHVTVMVALLKMPICVGKNYSKFATPNQRKGISKRSFLVDGHP
jgi:hypothetical protein